MIDRSPLAGAMLLAIASMALVAPATAGEPLRVVTTLPHLASIAKSIGGKRVIVESLGRADRDPHFIVPSPALMSRLNKADIYIESGLSLELWSEKVIDGARNPKIRVGQKGHLYAAQIGLTPIEIPTVISRAQGDVHPQGNPHVHLDPINGKLLARNICNHLKLNDPDGRKVYEAGLAAFEKELDERLFGKLLVKYMGGKLLGRLHRTGRLIPFLKKKKLLGKLGGWLAKAQVLRGKKVIAWHRTWSYFAKAFGFKVVGMMEPKPGVPPTPGHLAALVGTGKREKVAAVILTPYFSESRAGSVAKDIGCGLAVLPMDVGLDGVKDYFSLFDQILERLNRAVAGEMVGRK